MRGPLLYCVERADNPGIDPRDLLLSSDLDFSEESDPEVLGGVIRLSGRMDVAPPVASWAGTLYHTVGSGPARSGGHTREVTAIPYYAWANREAGPMGVWLRAEG